MKRLHFSVLAMGAPFLFLVVGEAISVFGAAIMEFGLGVWVFQNTGSVLDFSGVAIAAILPPVLVLPLAGHIADRVDCRYIIVAAGAVIGFMVLLLAAFHWQGNLHVGHIYLFNIVVSVTSAVRWPAYQSSLAKLLSNEQLASASGVMGVGNGVANIIGPVLGGSIISVSGLMGLISINVLAIFTGIALVLFALFYRNGRAAAFVPKPRTADAGVLHGTRSALLFLRSEPLMSTLLAYMVIQTALGALASTMLTPLVLAHYSARELGVILTCAALGGLSGSAMLTIARLENRLMIGVLAGDAILAACIFTVGMAGSSMAYSVCAFIALFAGTFGAGCGEALWLRKAHREYQGSIYGLIGAVSVATTAIVIATSGFLVDRVFEPLLTHENSWERWLAPVLSGKGRGIALLYLIAGAAGLALSLVALANVRMRKLDSLVPEAVEDSDRPLGLRESSVHS